MVEPVLQNAKSSEAGKSQNESNGVTGEEMKVSAALLRSLIKRISTLEEDMKMVKNKLGLEAFGEEKKEIIPEKISTPVVKEPINEPGPSEVSVSGKVDTPATGTVTYGGTAEVSQTNVKTEPETQEAKNAIKTPDKGQKEVVQTKSEAVKPEPQTSVSEKKDSKQTPQPTKQENKKFQQNKSDKGNRSFSNKRKNNQQRPNQSLNLKRQRNTSFNNRNQQNTSGNFNLFNNQPAQQRWEQNSFSQQPQPLLAFQGSSPRFASNLRQPMIPTAQYSSYPSSNIQQPNVWMRTRAPEPNYPGYMPPQQAQQNNPFGPSQRTWR